MNLHPPRSDSDTFDAIDAALTTLADKRNMWLGDELVTIHLLTSLIDQAQRCLTEPIVTARLNGISWDQIATALGTSPAEAYLRYDPEAPTADGRWPLDPDN